MDPLVGSAVPSALSWGHVRGGPVGAAVTFEWRPGVPTFEAGWLVASSFAQVPRQPRIHMNLYPTYMLCSGPMARGESLGGAN